VRWSALTAPGCVLDGGERSGSVCAIAREHPRPLTDKRLARRIACFLLAALPGNVMGPVRRAGLLLKQDSM
jgi:hypothetical protein